MRIAVTGGNGFIGRAVIKAAIDAGHEAWPFDRANGDDVLCQLKNLNGAEAVIHLAAMADDTGEPFSDPEMSVEVNMIGSYRIMQWCIDNGAKYIGTIVVDPSPPSIYAVTKIAAMRLATALAHNRNLKIAHVRTWNVYGPGQEHGIIPTFAKAAWSGAPIPVFGDGSQWVDLIHVNDVARILLVAATADRHNIIIDAGTGEGVAVMDVAQGIANRTGTKGGILLLPACDGEVSHKVAASGEGWPLLRAAGCLYPECSQTALMETVDSYKPTSNQ